VYDLAERAVPSHLLSMTPSEEECRTELVRRAGVHLGVATLRDLADYYRLKTAWAAEVVDGTDLVPVHVAGWREPAWADPARLEELSEGRLRGRHRTTLLSPFDSLIWDRTRTERIFRFSHRLEAYVPKDKREHGYFVMPLLAGGQLVGRVDPKRAGLTLVAQQVTLARRSAVPAMATALVEAATWVGCDNVAVETVRPADFTAPLRSALATPGL
jgi:uncharacterized protein YcaQ